MSQRAGARRLIDFRELSAIVGRRLSMSAVDHAIGLTIERGSACELIRPVAVSIRVPGGIPHAVSVRSGETPVELELERIGREEGRLIIG